MKTFYSLLAALFVLIASAQGRTWKVLAPDTLIHQQDSTLYHMTHTLDSVVITGDNTTHHADRDVVRITRAMRKGARNTAQMLGNIPGIDCDYSNNELTYYGSKNILILVDSIEKSSEYIKELHHLRFNKVDVVPNPTGKYANYDVLINLHTKPDYEGYEGNAFEQISVLPTDGNGKNKHLTGNYTSASFTYTKNKWNFVGRYNFKYQQSERNNTMEAVSNNHVNHLQETMLPPYSTKNFYRIHNAYAAVDYQIDKNHSVSASYNYSPDATDTYSHSTIGRWWMESDRRDTISANLTNRVNSSRHTLGLYYRGRSGAWNYTYDFNYTNDGWTSDRDYSQSTGYATRYPHRCHMDYVWTKSEANRRFFNNKFYVSAGYNFTWKDYEQKDRLNGNILSENTYRRNEFWTWLSYRISDDTDLNFSASAEHVHTESRDYEDNNMVYKLSGMLYHKFNQWLWMRFNYWCNVTHPQLDQVTEYGYFSDSLTYRSGNPALRTQIYHSTRLWLNFFKTFNIQAGYNYSPNMFATVTEAGEGTLSSGEYGTYITYMPQNTTYREFWTSFYIYKRIRAFTLSATIKYQFKDAEYGKYKNSNDGFSGGFNARYYNDKQFLTLQLGYNLNNSYDASVQGWNTSKMDYLVFYAGKDFFKQRMNMSIQYVSPRIFCDVYSRHFVSSDAMTGYRVTNIYKRMEHSMMLTLTYRFNGGKSVRQYNREMSGEK